MILALETSCDDTCAAVISPDDGIIRSNVISSQGVHDRYGGVVPEIASRHHLELIGDVVTDALTTAGATLGDVDLVAVTRGPGLVAALLVGVATAKALAAAYEKPLAAVDHLHGHIAASFLAPDPFEPPFVSLVASGGHTLLAHVRDHGPGYELLGQTLARRSTRAPGCWDSAIPAVRHSSGSLETGIPMRSSSRLPRSSRASTSPSRD
jgi:N6-L-threonylcarbamoyladenine synthase